MKPCSLIAYAASRNDTSLIRALVRQGFDVNARDRDRKTPLFYARERSTAQTLLDCGAEVNAKDEQGWTALLQSVTPPYNPAMTRLLIEHGARDENALPFAVQFHEVA